MDRLNSLLPQLRADVDLKFLDSESATATLKRSLDSDRAFSILRRTRGSMQKKEDRFGRRNRRSQVSGISSKEIVTACAGLQDDELPRCLFTITGKWLFMEV